MTKQKKEDKESFDLVMARIESLVGKLENSELSLEESLQAFEEGMNLVKRAEGILEKAEKRVEILLSGGEEAKDGSAETKPFETKLQIEDS